MTTLVPMLSPLIWTTMATGVSAGRARRARLRRKGPRDRADGADHRTQPRRCRRSGTSPLRSGSPSTWSAGGRPGPPNGSTAPWSPTVSTTPCSRGSPRRSFTKIRRTSCSRPSGPPSSPPCATARWPRPTGAPCAFSWTCPRTPSTAPSPTTSAWKTRSTGCAGSSAPPAPTWERVWSWPPKNRI